MVRVLSHILSFISQRALHAFPVFAFVDLILYGL